MGKAFAASLGSEKKKDLVVSSFFSLNLSVHEVSREWDDSTGGGEAVQVRI